MAQFDAKKWLETTYPYTGFKDDDYLKTRFGDLWVVLPYDYNQCPRRDLHTEQERTQFWDTYKGYFGLGETPEKAHEHLIETIKHKYKYRIKYCTGQLVTYDGKTRVKISEAYEHDPTHPFNRLAQLIKDDPDFNEDEELGNAYDRVCIHDERFSFGEMYANSIGLGYDELDFDNDTPWEEAKLFVLEAVKKYRDQKAKNTL